MFNNLYFQDYALLSIVFLFIIYASKKHLPTLINNIFLGLVVTAATTILLSLFSVGIALLFDATSIASIIAFKLYLVSTLIFTYILSIYIYIITFTKTERISIDNHILIKKIFIAVLGLSLVSLLCIFILPINIVNQVGYMTVSGMGFHFVYVINILCICFLGYRYITRFRYIKKEKSNFILYILALAVFSICLQILYPGITFLLYVDYFIALILYFSIDNPDLDLMNKLELAKKQAEEAEVSKTNALLKASHEIRTPLNTIIGFSESILDGTNSKEDIEYIKEASQNLLDTINNILELPNNDNQEFKLVYDKYNVQILMKQIEALAKMKLEDKNIKFEFEVESNIPVSLSGDSIRLKQIILNVIYNAIKYTKEGYIRFKIGSINIGNICRLIISIKDSGIGISEDTMDKIFDEKTIDKRAIREENHELDLNLATIKKLIEAMNGQIKIESEYNEGTSVTVTVDQTIVSDNKDETSSVEPKKDDFKGKKILIVDDDKMNLKVASRLLKKYNFEIDEVTNGLDCIDKIKNGERYDLIFLDDWMPNISGLETMKELDKIENFNTPVIVITANASSGMKENYLSQGFNDYISKPIERKELDRVIDKFLK